jgi:flagellar basal body-associated protein FliL
MANAKTKDINFYNQFADPSKKKNQSNLIIIIIIGVILIAVAGAYAVLFAKDQMLKSQISDLTAQTQDATLLERIKSSEEMAAETKKMNLILQVMQSNDAIIAEQDVIKDRITNVLLMKIVESENNEVTVNSFSYSDGTVTLSLTSATENEAASYVTRLRGMEVFAWIDYTGFAGSEGQYNYTITAVFETATDEGDQ